MNKAELIEIIDLSISLGQAWGVEMLVETDDPRWSIHHQAGVDLVCKMCDKAGISLSDIPTRAAPLDPVLTEAARKLGTGEAR